MKAPGPGLLPFVLGVRSRGFLAYVGELWRQYGDVFSIDVGRRTLLFAIHPNAVERISVSHRQNYDKVASYDPVREFLIRDGLVASTGELWRKQRKLMAPFFTPKGVQAYAGLMLRDSERLAARWEALAAQGTELDIGEEMTQVTASIILRAMFSSEAAESMRELRQSIEVMIDFANNRMTGLALPLWVPTQENRRFTEARAFVMGIVSRLISERRGLPEGQWPDDLLSRLMKAKDEETGHTMSESLLQDESITAFVAGHETTARTMTFAWLALARNPLVAQQLHAELDSVLGSRSPTVEDLRNLPYTLQVAKEVLRLYPPAPFYVRDAVGPDVLSGYDVPTGAPVMLSPYYTHRHPDFWPDPERFDPSRWSREREASRHSHAYHPFAAGQRVCIGNNFSLLETHLLLAVLAHRFVARLRPNYLPQWEMRGVLNLAGGLPMRLETRRPA